MSAKTRYFQCYIWVIRHFSNIGDKRYKHYKGINKTDEYVIMYTENPKGSADSIKKKTKTKTSSWCNQCFSSIVSKI